MAGVAEEADSLILFPFSRVILYFTGDNDAGRSKLRLFKSNNRHSSSFPHLHRHCALSLLLSTATEEDAAVAEEVVGMSPAKGIHPRRPGEGWGEVAHHHPRVVLTVLGLSLRVVFILLGGKTFL